MEQFRREEPPRGKLIFNGGQRLGNSSGYEAGCSQRNMAGGLLLGQCFPKTCCLLSSVHFSTSVPTPRTPTPGRATRQCGPRLSDQLQQLCLEEARGEEACPGAVDGRNPFRTPLKPWETIACWRLQGNRIISGCLMWCRIASIHSTELVPLRVGLSNWRRTAQ